MPSEKNTFVKNSPAENIRLSEMLAPVNYDIASPAKQKTNGSYKCVCRKRASKLRKAVGNGDCQIYFKKNQKIPPFFEKLTKKITARRSIDGVPSIIAKILAFPSFL